MKRDEQHKRTAKADLLKKTCPTCQRPFAWRKKWERDWDNVRFCSERCRRAKGAPQHEHVLPAFNIDQPTNAG